MSEYYAGQDCTCFAYGECECSCSVDWTDPEVYKLLKRIDELEEELDFKNRWVTQTCETGVIRAERKQIVTDNTEWVLAVTAPEQR